MRHHDPYRIAGQLLARVARISKKGWLMIGASLLLVFAALLWLGLTLLGWLWQQVPQLQQQGEHWLGDNAAQVLQLGEQLPASASEAAAPLLAQAEALSANAGQWLAGASTVVAASGLTEGERWLAEANSAVTELSSSGEQWLAALPAAVATLARQQQQGQPLPQRDVSGGDPVKPERFPGMVRIAFSQEGDSALYSYAGQGTIDDIARHYRDGYLAMGFRHQLLAADQQGERHQFVSDQLSLELQLVTTAPEQVLLTIRQRHS